MPGERQGLTILFGQIAGRNRERGRCDSQASCVCGHDVVGQPSRRVRKRGNNRIAADGAVDVAAQEYEAVMLSPYCNPAREPAKAGLAAP